MGISSLNLFLAKIFHNIKCQILIWNISLEICDAIISQTLYSKESHIQKKAPKTWSAFWMAWPVIKKPPD